MELGIAAFVFAAGSITLMGISDRGFEFRAAKRKAEMRRLRDVLRAKLVQGW